MLIFMNKLKKIVFILPRGPVYRYKTGAFGKFIRYAPLTIPTLIAFIPPEMNIQTEVYDEGVEIIDKGKIDGDIICISCITGTSQRAYAYADYFRSKGKTVVMGGVHPTLMPEEAMQHADAVVTGIALQTWPQLLRDFEAGKMQKIYKQAEDLCFAKWPLPKRSCYEDKKLRFISINSVQATYGCPNICEFCVTPYSCKGYHQRPVEDVIEEIKQIKSKYIVFVDPSPIENVEYAKKLYRAMIPLKKKWASPSTIKMAFDDELLSLAAQSGCKGLLIGFESVSQESLKGIHKNFNSANQYYVAAKKFHEKGIAIMGCFVFGLDTDDKNIFKRTIEFVNKANIDLPRFTVVTPYPRTPLYERMQKEDRIIDKNWIMYDCQHVVIQPKQMTPEELQEGLHWAWKEAYKISSIIKRIAGARCFLELALLTNLTYRMYGKRLPNYTKRVMTDFSDITG